MLAARLYGPRLLRVERVSVPEPRAGWVLVRTVAVGVCGTDKAMYTGGYRLRKTPLTPGHEAVGVVVSAPPEYRGPRGETRRPGDQPGGARGPVERALPQPVHPLPGPPGPRHRP